MKDQQFYLRDAWMRLSYNSVSDDASSLWLPRHDCPINAQIIAVCSLCGLQETYEKGTSTYVLKKLHSSVKV